MPFPNLPYYFDGDRKITQSHAIIRYLARKHDLVGKTECENIRIDMTEGESADLRQAWMKIVYSSKEEVEKSKEDYKKNTLLPKLSNLSKYLGNHPWFAGERITYVDFLLYELFDINRRLFPSCLDDFDNLKQYTKRFESLEPIKKYMNSNRYMKDPLNGPMAGFGGK
ncbi:Glutathione S-transferase [Armadillidium vulgare]|nr:Glutathione S-transferase [Armadillidium vulgare]